MYFFVRQFLQGNELKLADMFFNPEKLHEPGMIDDLIRGMSTTSMETLDQFITDEVTNHLFEDKATPYSGLGRVSDKMSKVTIFGPKCFWRVEPTLFHPVCLSCHHKPQQWG